MSLQTKRIKTYLEGLKTTASEAEITNLRDVTHPDKDDPVVENLALYKVAVWKLFSRPVLLFLGKKKTCTFFSTVVNVNKGKNKTEHTWKPKKTR